MIRNKKIAELSLYLQRITNGDRSFDIRTNKEGELSILKNEIYKVTHALTEQAEALQKDKLELASALSDISHQLKTPLTALGVMADLLEDDALPADKRKEFIENLHAGLSRMEWLVLTLLKLARLDADAAALKQENIALADLIGKALSPLLIPIEVKELTVTVKGEKLITACDMDWTAEALGNILKNAIDNTPQGGTIAIAYGENPLYTYITVRDGGPGIDKEDMPHLFKRFYRGKNANPDSVGIGLALSLAVMRKQNGDIEAENDNGAVFTLKFYY
ncbi:MAG: HAMP domain-containing histidine kinase [Oscillospiraceae bacterium]|nr:HAMP domain-containing histidine kinase [Oscillospiraceae bacterium]